MRKRKRKINGKIEKKIERVAKSKTNHGDRVAKKGEKTVGRSARKIEILEKTEKNEMKDMEDIIRSVREIEIKEAEFTGQKRTSD